jgi:hypothetical protein
LLTLGKPFSIGKGRRISRKGGLFTIIRVLGILLQVGGVLVLIGSVIGFFILLLKSAPTLVDAVGHPESYFSGFIITGIFVWLVTPLVLAIIGVIFTCVGIVLYLVTTQPTMSKQRGDADKKGIDGSTLDPDDKNEPDSSGRVP